MASTEFKVDVRGDFRKVDLDLRVLHPRVIAQASADTMNIQISRIRGRARDSIASATQKIPARLIGKRMGQFRASRRWLKAGCMVRLQPMPVQALIYPEKPSTDPGGGVTAGEAKFAGAWAGVYRKGKRKGKPNVFVGKRGSAKGIARALIMLAPYAPILPKVGERMRAQEFQGHWRNAVAMNLKKYAGTLR